MGSGSKIDVHTVLKLIDDAITATSASSGASSGSGHLVDVDRLARVLVARTAPRRTSPARRRARPRPGTTRAAPARRLLGGSPLEDRGPDAPRSRRHSGRETTSVAVPMADYSSVTPVVCRTVPPREGAAHARFRHRLVGPHADRQALRRARRSSPAIDLGGAAIQAALDRAGIGGDAGRLRAHGPGAPGRAGPDHRAPGRGEGRHPDDGAGDAPSTRCASRASTRSTSPTR